MTWFGAFVGRGLMPMCACGLWFLIFSWMRNPEILPHCSKTVQNSFSHKEPRIRHLLRWLWNINSRSPVDNKDSYILNKCCSEKKFSFVELCDDILVDTGLQANFEFSLSMFRSSIELPCVLFFLSSPFPSFPFSSHLTTHESLQYKLLSISERPPACQFSNILNFFPPAATKGLHISSLTRRGKVHS